MTVNKLSTVLVSADEVPDLSTPMWQERFAAATVKRGRPKLENAKVSTTIRLDRHVVDTFRATGPGWQTRINDTLARAAKRMTSKS